MTTPGPGVRLDAGVRAGSSAQGEVIVRPAREDELDAAGEVVRAAYEADHLANPGYLAIVADARGRSSDAVVAVALGAARPRGGGLPPARPP